MLATVIAISAFPYVTSLSFYSDDWYILSTFQADVAQHRFGLGSAMRGFEARPVQGLYLAGLYAVFGLHPLGYHLVNLVVITASVLLFHSLLVRLGFERLHWQRASFFSPSRSFPPCACGCPLRKSH